MEIITTPAAAQRQTRPNRKLRVLVPTMGALHRGHLELIRIAREAAGDGGEVAVSIFVNPLQFGPGSDLEKYPRPVAADEDLCRKAGVDLLFRPEEKEMYDATRSVSVEETALSKALCGRSRPGHFRGVCTVVCKLFHLLAPNAAIFGEKDFQQLVIIQRMVRDLNFPIEIVGAPIVREEDGLACSSRNQYLSPAERQQAGILRKACLTAMELAGTGERSSKQMVAAARAVIERASLARIDYVELVDAEQLQPIEHLQSNSLLALAVFFGRTRLIDNIQLR
jgi:pantoate--beta-alanine ligase